MPVKSHTFSLLKSETILQALPAKNSHRMKPRKKLLESYIFGLICENECLKAFKIKIKILNMYRSYILVQ